MMNSLPAGFYLPVFVAEDSSKRLFFLSKEHEASIKNAFAHFDILLNLESNKKVMSFMSSQDIEMGTQGSSSIRALKSIPRSEEHMTDRNSYEEWLSDKAILRTERFFPGRPVWNIASTRHALLGKFQFKGIGFSGVSGRCDYLHIHGNLDIYLALFETVMSWHFESTPIRTQKVVALWRDDHLTNPKILMLREASSYRLAQIIGIDLEDVEKEIILKSLQVSESTLREKFLEVLKNYAWFIAHSYEYTSPTYDNLMLDGSLIDCSSLTHYNGSGWVVPLHLIRKEDGLWGNRYNVHEQADVFISYTLKAYRNLGLEMDLESATEYFWQEVEAIVGPSARIVRTSFADYALWETKPLADWEKFLRNALPEAEVAAAPSEQSKFYRGQASPNHMALFLVKFKCGPRVEFAPYEVTDRIFHFFNANRDVEPIPFADAIIRSSRK